MIWTTGHFWVLEKPLIVSVPYFNYKYVLITNGIKPVVKWEAGVDRIADLRLLPDISPTNDIT